MNHDEDAGHHLWSGESYPSAPRQQGGGDETAFLEEIARLGHAWPQIMNDRNLRAETIENRISNARLDASLPHFASFGFVEPDPAPPQPGPTRQFQNQKSLRYQQTELYAPSAGRPPPAYPDPPPPAAYFPPSPPPPPVVSDNSVPSSRFNASGYPAYPSVLQPLPATSFHSNEFDERQHLTGTTTVQRLTEPGPATFYERDSWQRYDVDAQPRRSSVNAQSTTSGLHWWEQPRQSADAFPPAPRQEQLPTPPPPFPYPQQQQSQYPPHSRLRQFQPEYRPFPPPSPIQPEVPRRQVPTMSQLPYQPPSREWNEAPLLAYPSTWEPAAMTTTTTPGDHFSAAGSTMPNHHYHEASISSTDSAVNLVAAGLTYATSATSQSTDHSRQSSVNPYGVDYGGGPGNATATVNDHTWSATAALAGGNNNPAGGGIGKRARFDSAHYARPPLNPQPRHFGSASSSTTPSSSSQATNSSTSLPTTTTTSTRSTSLDQYAAGSTNSTTSSVSSPVPAATTTTSAMTSQPRLVSTSVQPTTTPSTTAAAPTVLIPSNRRGNKSKVDVPIACVSCQRKLARLILRGQKHELEVPFEASFHCLDCVAAIERGGGDAGSGGGTAFEESPGGTSTTTMSERSPSDSPHVFPPGMGGPGSRRTSTVSNPSSTATGVAAATGSSVPIPTTFRKKNKRLDVGHATLTACDVCLMDRAKGSVLPREPDKGHTIDFQIEVVCVSCDEKYQRCSDCGGGGGVRLGTGKWRSKELFKDGKRTCALRHQRLGAFPEMEYQVWKNTDIPRDELDEVSEKCGELFANQMLGAIAIPEVLERNGAIWTSFAEAQSHAYSGWRGMDPMIRYDAEPSQGIRRYLALRLCAPNLRKTTRKADAAGPQGGGGGDDHSPRTGQIFKGDKEIVGYIIAEWDMQRGVLFLALVIPWDATGEAYDATTLLLQALCSRVQRDQREENMMRSTRGEALLPKLERVFTMLFFKTGSRMITQLTKKRGFAPIDEYLASNPRADPLAFPPHRPIYLPVERQAGWLVLVRTLRENADGSLDDWSARRSADEERGKRKEARARALREKREKAAQPHSRSYE